MVDAGKRKGARQIELDEMNRNELDKVRAEVLKAVLFGKFSLTKAAVWASSSGLMLKYSVIKKKRKKQLSLFKIGNDCANYAASLHLRN